MGVVLALPILVPFYDDLKVGFIGSHTSAVDGPSVFPISPCPRSSIPMSMVRSFPTLAWTPCGAASVAISGRACALLRAWPLRIKESAAAHLPRRVDSRRDGRYLQLPRFPQLWNLIPVVSRSSFERYSTPGCELAIIILAAFGLYDFTQSVARSASSRQQPPSLVLVIAWRYEARSYQSTVAFSSRDIHIVFLGLQALPFIALFFLLVFGRLHRFSYTRFSSPSS